MRQYYHRTVWPLVSVLSRPIPPDLYCDATSRSVQTYLLVELLDGANIRDAVFLGFWWHRIDNPELKLWARGWSNDDQYGPTGIQAIFYPLPEIDGFVQLKRVFGERIIIFSIHKGIWSLPFIMMRCMPVVNGADVHSSVACFLHSLAPIPWD